MTGFVPPPYPYDRLQPILQAAERHEGGAINLSIGAPSDPPPPAAVAMLANSASERGYPPSIGSVAYREAAARWYERRVGVTVSAADEVAAAVGSKEFVAGLPNYLRLRSPDRDTVLYPAVSYPSYAMGATLGGCRAVPVPVRPDWTIDLEAIDPSDAARALVLWVNTPANPAGSLDDLGQAAAWGRANAVPVVSDECYIEFTWAGPPRSILQHGTEGVLALHSLSKRSNWAGARSSFYAGDVELVHYLREVRKHGGFMQPGPVQAASVVALDDDAHVDEQRQRYRERLEFGCELMAAAGAPAEMPQGGFYLWVAAPGGDAWALTAELAERTGVVVSPGEFYGEAGAGHVRVALVAPMEQLRLARSRL
ncbi:MAG: aminotransferase class I/II-fold pyridoxal phosphate-dependent enzyme [Acidimicrobiales bacterium]|nr:aminotransferase class I/II-fold pyridoxal phosphate-dependent enzyme [Acidimicrobiales bacterium]